MHTKYETVFPLLSEKKWESAIAIGFLILMSLASCNKEELSDSCSDSTKLTRVRSADLTLEEITYTGDCNVYEYIVDFSYKKYSYDPLNRLIKVEEALLINPLSCFIPPTTDGGTYTDPRKATITRYYDLEYDDTGKLIKKSCYYLTGNFFELVSYQTYQYENGYIEQIDKHNPSDELTEKNIYTRDENGNVILDEYYIKNNGEDFSLVLITACTFDDLENPYRVFNYEGTPGKYSNTNNILVCTRTNLYSGSAYVNTDSFSYAYNDMGYPVEVNSLQLTYNE
jgi:hypothetical protein